MLATGSPTRGALAVGDASNYNVHYDGAGTLALRDATIGDDGILVEAEENGTNAGDLSLTIVLEGESSDEGNVWLGKNEGGSVGKAGYREEGASTSLTIMGSGSLDVQAVSSCMACRRRTRAAAPCSP